MKNKAFKWTLIVGVLFCIFILFSCNNVKNDVKQNDEKSIYDANNTKHVIIKGNEKEYKQVLKIREKLNKKLNIGDNVLFGQCYQKENNLYEKNDIEWKVIDIVDNRALLITDKVIEYMGMSKIDDDITYDNSDIKEWLNESFYINSFSEFEKDAVIFLKHINENVGKYDKVFLLNKNEQIKYFGDNKDAVKNDNAVACATEYVLQKNSNSEYIDNNVGHGIPYWLCDNGKNIHTFMWVDTNGLLNEDGYIQYEEIGVRPCIWVDIGRLPVRENIKFGFYEQDNDLENGKEEIEWQVIGCDRFYEQLLLISKDVIDFYYYNKLPNVSDGRFYDSHYEYYKNYFESDLHNYITNDFFNNAFSEYQQQLFMKSRITTVTYEDSGVVDYLHDYDCCYIPGEDELGKYFIMHHLSDEEINLEHKNSRYEYGTKLSDLRLKVKPSIYAKNKIIDNLKLYVNDETGYCDYWIRDDNYDENEYRKIINNYGMISSSQSMGSRGFCPGIRPIISLSISALFED